ncbi:hypothetical protein [Cloacibacillus sp. An23]|uniref:hypothetical protein n=1 Tax=Cloacibacillus sp. An23 TaxID=1965591 RepID=UPI000B3A2861|nr:hypothetical protein [Cloacibacillus sp. An23]OUO93857.1 hypothetical protein B5F39_06660 [Cloacibacillus sp. An23]
MERTREYRRRQRRRVIKRKISILRRVGGEEYVNAWTRGRPGRLAKGKIHCSCHLCRTKSCDFLPHREMKQAESARCEISETLCETQ